MEENKYICPECGSEMDTIYEKPAFNLSCPKCGCKIATTRWDEIDLDDTKYQIQLDTIDNPTIDQIKYISKFTGANFIACKKMFEKGSLIFEGSAVDILEKKKELELNNILFSIKPYFKY